MGDVDQGADWGHLFTWHGYLFKDNEKHTLEDLRDLFESSDPHSPSFSTQKPSPYRLASYPRHFVALDEKVLSTEKPKVWMASTLDFHGASVRDDLGWIIGRIDAAEASITFVNWDVANMGPEECLDEETLDKLWLSDLKSYRGEEWEREQEY